MKPVSPFKFQSGYEGPAFKAVFPLAVDDTPNCINNLEVIVTMDPDNDQRVEINVWQQGNTSRNHLASGTVPITSVSMLLFAAGRVVTKHALELA